MGERTSLFLCGTSSTFSQRVPFKSPGKVGKENEQPVESSWFLWGKEVLELVAFRDKSEEFLYFFY